jgi:hypothetical protein
MGPSRREVTMRVQHLSTALLTLGLLVGLAAVVGLLVGFEPARLPAALLNIAAYKLTFIAAFGLMAAGAALARLVRRLDGRVARDPAADAPALGRPFPASSAPGRAPSGGGRRARLSR